MSGKNVPVLDKFFDIFNMVMRSDTPLASHEIAEELGYNVRTVQRYLVRMIAENVIGVSVRANTTLYEYHRMNILRV